MKQKVMEYMVRHQLVSKNTTVLIGVSGGPDSMALLHFYMSIQDEWNLKLVALSVDHQLRGDESKEDLLYVQQMCEKWKINFVAASFDVKAYSREKQIGTQVAAREVRYHFYAEQMKKFHADYLALGHHGDDQIETMLMSFTRSSSPLALSGIPVKRDFFGGQIVRPFLVLQKKDVLEYCQNHAISPRMDPSNEETDYTRNYFRKHVIPLIKEKNNRIHITVQRLSESLQEDEQFLQNEAKKVINQVVVFDEIKRNASFKIAEFKKYSPALQRRAYHLILSYLYEKLPENLSYVHEETFLSLLDKPEGNVQLDFPHGLTLEKSYETLLLYYKDQYPENNSFHQTIHIPATLDFPDGAKLTASYTDSPREEDKYIFVCDVNKVTLPLYIRTRQNGDRMSWKGLKGSKKIKDIFIDAKIPRKERDDWPIVTDNNGEILWLIGLRKGKKAAIMEEKGSLFIQLDYKQAACGRKNDA